MAKKSAVTAVMEMPVAFGQVSIGDKYCRIGINVDRSSLSVAQADKNLCEKRLSGTLIAKMVGDHPDQKTLDGMEDTELKAVFDVKGFSVSADAIGFGLTMAIASVDVSTLAHFAKRAGNLCIHDIQAIPEPEKNGEAEDAE